MSSNITVIKSGFTSVTIHTLRVTDNLNNALEQYNRLKVASRQTEDWQKYLLDFKKISQVVEVTGYIAKEQDGSTAVNTLRQRLQDIFESGVGQGLTTIRNGGSDASPTWYGQSDKLKGTMTALEFREVPADDNTPLFYLVTFSFLVGDKR